MPIRITLLAISKEHQKVASLTTAVPKIISESVSNAPMNKNAHILFKEAKNKRPELISPAKNSSTENTKSVKGYGLWSKNPLFCRSRPQQQEPLASNNAKEQLSKLHSVSQLSEKILENCSSSPLNNVPNIRLTFSDDNDGHDDFSLVKPGVKLSRQVEHFGRLIHERNSQFVSRFSRSVNISYSQNSFYFVDDDILALESNTFKPSDVDHLPVVDQMHQYKKIRENIAAVTNPNVNVDSCTTPATTHNNTETKKTMTTKRKVSLDDHHKWNRFLKDISQLTIEIDDGNEEFL
jgi:hypothetical protein